MSTHPGESAFTRPSSANDWGKDPGAPGLTKREYFAALALQGLLADSGSIGIDMQEITEQATLAADSLIASLNGVKS